MLMLTGLVEQGIWMTDPYSTLAKAIDRAAGPDSGSCFDASCVPALQQPWPSVWRVDLLVCRPPGYKFRLGWAVCIFSDFLR